jgi:lysozyme
MIKKILLGTTCSVVCICSMTSLSQAADDLAINTIKRFEGCSSVEYNDSVGKPTIGYGHLIVDGDGTKYTGKTLTEKEMNALLLSDIAEKANITNYLSVSLNSKQKAAITSLCFNIGVGNFSESTVLEKINASDFEGSYEYFGHWRKAGGTISNGLIKRRFTEMFLFADKSLDSNDSSIPSEQWGTDPMPITDVNWGMLSSTQREESVLTYDDLVS